MPKHPCDQDDLDGLSFEGYRAVDVLGRGKSKGTVYEVWSRVGGHRAAAKWPITKREQDLWLQLAWAPGRLGLPRLLAEGSIDGEPYVVTEILGKPLAHLFNDIKCCPFSCRWRIVSIVGRLLLRRLQFLHHAGVVHCDINPSNVLMGVPHAVGKDRHRPFFVDLGTAQRYPGNPPLSEYVGTVDFNSIRSAEGGVRRPRDDCEALGWMLLHGLFGELPWFDRTGAVDWSSREERVKAARQCQEAKLLALESGWQGCGRGWAHLRQTPAELDRFLRLSRGVNGADHGALADLLGARENLTQASAQEEEDLMLLTLAIHDGLQNAHGQKAFPMHSEAPPGLTGDAKSVWEVIGGGDVGGITVRRGKLISSEQLPMRLLTGALLLEEARDGERLQYTKLSGEGPDIGWVSITVKGKPLLAEHGQKSSLLDPAERRRQGLKQREGSTVWWADWEDLFAELYGGEVGQPPQAEPAPTRELSLASSAPRVDIVLFGATGLVGMMACRLMQDQFHDRSFALAGRSERKLRLLVAAVERRLGSSSSPSSVFRGGQQVSRQEDMYQVARSARVVVDFSGPKFQLGQALAEACVRSGTHYVDTTTYEGDMLLAQQVRENLDAPAKASKVSLVYFCGGYPVQVDVGTWTMVSHIRRHYKRSTRRVDVFQTMDIKLSGSAMQSFIGPPGFDLELRRSELLPFLLGGVRAGGPRDVDEDELVPVELGDAPGLWGIDGGRNAEVMVGRCSCGLFDGTAEPYGEDFVFKNWDVQLDPRNFEKNLINNAVLKRSHEDLRLANKIPSPGQGADRRHRQQMWCRRILVAEVDEPGQQLVLHRCLQPGPSGLGDPSEGTSCVALLAALCLLSAIDAGSELRFGFGTPSWHLAHLGYPDWLEANGYWDLGPIKEGRPSPEDFLRMVFSGP